MKSNFKVLLLGIYNICFEYLEVLNCLLIRIWCYLLLYFLMFLFGSLKES